MIHATFPARAVVESIEAASAVDGSRTVAGVAVPYGIEGRVSNGETVRFLAGSLDPAARPPLLRDHERARPIGRVTAAADRGDRLEVTARVSATRDGDEALTLAADGVLAMFSVGVEPTDYRFDADGVLEVAAGEWVELSLLTIGAFPAAQVQTVTASPPEMEPPMETLTPVEPDPTDPTDPDEPDEILAAVEPVAIMAGRGRGRPTRPASPYADVTLRRLSGLISAAADDVDRRTELQRVLQAAGPLSSRGIEAALVDVTLVGTDNVGLGYRPAYQAELVEIVSHGSPLVDVLRQGDLQRGDYPTKTFTRWTKTPVVAEQTAEKAEINSTPVSIGPASTPTKSWATGNDVSQQTLDLGSPSFVEDYIRAAGADYATKIDAYAATTLLAAASAATVTAGMDLVEVVGAMFAALDPTGVPDGRFFLAVSWDQMVSTIGLKNVDAPAFWSGSVSFGSMSPSAELGGLSIFVDSNLPASTYLLGQSSAATWYDLPGTPFNLRAVNVGQLGLDLAVYGYGALAVQYPDAFVKATIPPVAGRSSR